MSVFEDMHAARVTGSLTMFDRLIFKGHLTGLYKPGSISAFLWSRRKGTNPCWEVRE
jgi:hypothetical protein